jgi:hypothetical protein
MRRDEHPPREDEVKARLLPADPGLYFGLPHCRISLAAVSVILRERSRTRDPRLQRRSRDTRHFVV